MSWSYVGRGDKKSLEIMKEFLSAHVTSLESNEVDSNGYGYDATEKWI